MFKINRFATGAAVASILAAVGGWPASGATAAQLPTFGLAGIPITPHQSSVVGSTYVQQQSPGLVEIEPSRLGVLTLGGMPASPHQIAVLRPRQKQQASAH
jgi:hypothetical protein